jgi:hypothetical protein
MAWCLIKPRDSFTFTLFWIPATPIYQQVITSKSQKEAASEGLERGNLLIWISRNTKQ